MSEFPLDFPFPLLYRKYKSLWTSLLRLWLSPLENPTFVHRKVTRQVIFTEEMPEESPQGINSTFNQQLLDDSLQFGLLSQPSRPTTLSREFRITQFDTAQAKVISRLLHLHRCHSCYSLYKKQDVSHGQAEPGKTGKQQRIVSSQAM